MEHRHSERVPCDLEVRVRYRDEELPHCRIVNAGADGVLVECPGRRLPRGVSLAMALPRDGDEPVWVHGLVIHSDDGRAGVCLGDMPGATHHFIETLCLHHLDRTPPARRRS